MHDGILPTLRAATSGAHQQLENSVQIEQRVGDIAAYRELLEKFWGWYQPLEQLLRQLPGWPYAGYDPGTRTKVPWLEQDLMALGLTEEDISALPRCANLPQTASLGSGFGCAYVIEGATLGGRHISALLKDSLIPEGARAFFSSYGAEVGQRWKEFLAAMQDFAAVQQHEQGSLLKAAQESFTSLQNWLTLKTSPV